MHVGSSKAVEVRCDEVEEGNRGKQSKQTARHDVEVEMQVE